MNIFLNVSYRMFNFDISQDTVCVVVCICDTDSFMSEYMLVSMFVFVFVFVYMHDTLDCVVRLNRYTSMSILIGW